MHSNLAALSLSAQDLPQKSTDNKRSVPPITKAESLSISIPFKNSASGWDTIFQHPYSPDTYLRVQGLILALAWTSTIPSTRLVLALSGHPLRFLQRRRANLNHFSTGYCLAIPAFACITASSSLVSAVDCSRPAGTN